MKKVLVFGLLLGTLCLFTSCLSTMKLNKSAGSDIPEVFKTKTEPSMEFIGFKADANILSTSSNESVKLLWTGDTCYFPSDFELWKSYKSDTSLSKLGNLLEKNNVAYDQSFAYFGIYSLQELELYKSQKRFVTFIEVDKNKLKGKIKDPTVFPAVIFTGIGSGLTIGGATLNALNSNNDSSMQSKSIALEGIGIGTMAGGLLLYTIPCTTELTYEGEFQVYVYDTQDKKIIYKDSVTVLENDKFKGSFFNEKTDKTAVYQYYGTIVQNALLKKYAEVDNFINYYLKK